MNARRLLAVTLLASAFAVAGCTADSPPSATPTAAETAAAVSASDIATVDDAIAWTESLDSSVTADDLSTGILAIGALVPTLDLGMAGNSIGQDLVALNADVLADPDTAGTKVDDLRAIISDIEAAQ